MDIVNDRRKTFSSLYWISAFVQIIYAVIFAVESRWVLAGLDAFLAFRYATIADVAKKTDDYKTMFRGGTINIAVFLIIHYLLLGPDFAFQYISLGTIPLIFFAAYVAGKSVNFSKMASLIAFVAFVVMNIIVSFIEYPLLPVRDVAKHIIIGFNLLSAFMMSINFMSLFVIKTTADANALENKNEDLEQSANIDALTGLRNRLNIETYIKRAIYQASGEGKDCSFLMCDIDNFKHINDTYGHDCGDQVLKNIASVIKSEIRPDDLAFRWGGEEILIIVNAKGYIAKKVAERCRNAIEQSSVTYQDKEIKVTITIGGVSYYQGATRDTLINKADENLYIGKKNGKNQVVM